jgi:hypothetical protein
LSPSDFATGTALNGVLQFAANQTISTIQLAVQDDLEPEALERAYFQTGHGDPFSPDSQQTIVVNANDLAVTIVNATSTALNVGSNLSTTALTWYYTTHASPASLQPTDSQWVSVNGLAGASSLFPSATSAGAATVDLNALKTALQSAGITGVTALEVRGAAADQVSIATWVLPTSSGSSINTGGTMNTGTSTNIPSIASLSIAPTPLLETGVATVTITLSTATSSSITIPWKISTIPLSGDAGSQTGVLLSPSDFAVSNGNTLSLATAYPQGVVQISASNTSGTFTIPLFDDALLELSEYAYLQIGHSGTNGTFVADMQAVLNVAPNDLLLTLNMLGKNTPTDASDDALVVSSNANATTLNWFYTTDTTPTQNGMWTSVPGNLLPAQLSTTATSITGTNLTTLKTSLSSATAIKVEGAYEGQTVTQMATLSGSASGGGTSQVQAPFLTQAFVRVLPGAVYAMGNNSINGTSSTVTGNYNLNGMEKVSLMYSLKTGLTTSQSDTALISAILVAADSSAFATALTAAAQRFDIHFQVLVASADITGDSVAESSVVVDLQYQVSTTTGIVYFGSQSSVTGLTPIVLDLNDDHSVVSVYPPSNAFQIAPQTPSVLKGWISTADALLVRDLNGNNSIDDGSELFGAGTLLADGQFAQDGFMALATLDNNADGILDTLDLAFSELGLWQDFNGNGMTDSGEITSLADHHIVRLDLNAHASMTMDHGNRLGLESSYQTADGLTHDLVDVFFDSIQGAAGLVAAAENMAAVTKLGVDLVQALSEAGFGAEHVQAGDCLTVDDNVAALLVQAGLLTAEPGARVDIRLPNEVSDLHLSLQDLSRLGADIVHLSDHALVDLGINSVTRQSLNDILTTLQAQRTDGSQPLFAEQGATLVMDNAIMNDLLLGQAQGDPMVHAMLQTLVQLGVRQLDGVDTVSAVGAQSIQATQSAVLVQAYLGGSVEAQLLGQADTHDLSHVFDHDMLAKSLA